jgi:hypothetical protein
MALNSIEIYIVPQRFVCWHQVSPKYSYLLLLYVRTIVLIFLEPSTREKPRSICFIFSAALRERSADTLSGSKGTDTCLQISIECQSECAQNNKCALPKKDAIRVYSFTRRPRKGRREKCDPNGIIYGNSESSCTPPPTSTSQTQQRARRHWLTPADGNECALAAFSNCT